MQHKEKQIISGAKSKTACESDCHLEIGRTLSNKLIIILCGVNESCISKNVHGTMSQYDEEISNKLLVLLNSTISYKDWYDAWP